MKDCSPRYTDRPSFWLSRDSISPHLCRSLNSISDLIQLPVGDPWVLFRCIARCLPPYRPGNHANNSAEPERSSPAMVGNQPRKQWRRKTASSTHSRKDEAIDKTSLLLRDPSCHKLIRSRVDNGLTSTQCESNRN